MVKRKRGMYECYVKRLLDVIGASVAILGLFWLYLTFAVVVRIKIGAPVLFKQPRPGLIDEKTGKEHIFTMYKFRTMSNERDENGILLPDEQRLSKYGKWMRTMSLDELPEVFNILKGDMSFIGPRPQLVRDMVFMSDTVRMRHTARPGLSGLAQVNGRNAVTWDQKFEWDLKYIEKVSFSGDLKIALRTVAKVLGRSESAAELNVTDDYGDWLLKQHRVSQSEYDALYARAEQLLSEYRKG